MAMRWKKAHQRKRQAMLCAKKRKAVKKKLFAATGWREWLKMLGPEFWEAHLHQESFINHFWERARSRPALSNRRVTFPRYPADFQTSEGEVPTYTVGPSRFMSIPCEVRGDRLRVPSFVIIVDDDDPDIAVAPPGFEERARKFWEGEKPLDVHAHLVVAGRPQLWEILVDGVRVGLYERHPELFEQVFEVEITEEGARMGLTGGKTSRYYPEDMIAEQLYAPNQP